MAGADVLERVRLHQRLNPLVPAKEPVKKSCRRAVLPLVPSPLAGEGGEPAKAGEPGEGFFFAVRRPLTWPSLREGHPLPQGERVTERVAALARRAHSSL